MDVTYLIEQLATALELAGVGVLVAGALLASLRYVVALIHRRPAAQAYRVLRSDLGRAILLGLEFLVGADIVRTVATAPTLPSVAALALIVLIRTFLSWSLEVEIDGVWPWRRLQAERLLGHTLDEPEERS
jgi:uncharacterized membrane protein